MKIQIISIILLSLFLFGCTESNYITIGNLNNGLNIMEGINMPNIKLPSYVPGDFEFVPTNYDKTDQNEVILLNLPDVEYGKQWELIVREDIVTRQLCDDKNSCETIDFEQVPCFKGIDAGENVNYYYCRFGFYRQLITDDGSIGEEEILDINFYLDSRKFGNGKILNKYDSNNFIPKEAFGVNGVIHDTLENYFKEEK